MHKYARHNAPILSRAPFQPECGLKSDSSAEVLAQPKVNNTELTSEPQWQEIAPICDDVLVP